MSPSGRESIVFFPALSGPRDIRPEGFFFLFRHLLFLLGLTGSRLSLELCQPIFINISDFLSCLAVAWRNMRLRSSWVGIFEGFFLLLLLLWFIPQHVSSMCACFQTLTMTVQVDVPRVILTACRFDIVWKRLYATSSDAHFQVGGKDSKQTIFIFWLSMFAGSCCEGVAYISCKLDIFLLYDTGFNCYM